MLFNRHGLQQKNWRMVKKGKHILFGCSLFFVVGGVSVNGPQVTYAKEISELEAAAKQDKVPHIVNKKTTIENPTLQGEKQVESSRDKVEDTAVLTEDEEKTLEKKEVNKKSLKELVDKIKNTDISKKTEKSVKELNIVLSRAEKALDNKEITQEEIDKEVKLLKEVFEKLEDKPREDKKSEIKEKDDKSNSEKDTKEKQQVNNTEDVARRYNEKITKATNIVKEINSLASGINYEFSDSEKELVSTIEKLPTTDNNSEESIQKLLNEAIYLRNRVANRVTRANSGRRDPRNGKVIDKNGESGFRGVVYTHKENRRNGNLIENGNTAVYYNSDEIWSLVEIKGERVGNERKFTTYVRGKIVEDVTPYYIVTVGFTGNSPIKGLKMQVAYWDKQAGKAKGREIEHGRTEINNPITNAAIRGVVGEGAIVQPGRYEVHIASNTRVAPNQLKPYTFTFIIKPQSERNTVKDLSQTYVDDVRHLTENEKTALIEKFKTEHPDVMKPSGHKSDFDHAEVSADGTTMTIHFKDGFNPKTIQTNATNDVEAKHSSLTAYFGDSKELYTNPRGLVRSKTGNEVPTTAQVTYKTPFNLQQVGTRNVVVTTTYENGATKDITTPYTVLDFIGKQDKKINQNQSGQLGDARNYITVSDNSALPGEFTVRWKGSSSTVDTSAAGVQYKEIEILRGNHLMKTVRIPVEIVDNINPTITAPDSVLLTRLEGLPSEINISAQDNNKGVGLKDGNPITVENLPNPLFYNPKTSKIEINGVIPNNFQNGKSSIQVTVKAVDRKGNTATKNITFNIQSQTQKYTAVANPKIQEVSHAQTPDPGTSISTTGLPANTQYKWERKPDTNTPGNKEGVVKVTYPDGSTDTVNVTVKVRKLSDEHEPTATKIVKNQNDSVSNNDLKAAVTINNNGNSKVRSVTSVGNISTTNAGIQTINATVTYIDGTTDFVSIPLEVKDITAPTIQTPTDRQNWDLIALDRTLPSIKLASEDNTGGTGIKSTTVTGLPDFLVYDNATKTIKFKNGVQEVTKLPDGQDSKTYNVNIQVTDNSNNSSRRQVTITVKSMTTKYTATANPQKQTVSYGQTPNTETSINKNGLPTGTKYTWRTIPNTTTGPGEKTGVVIVTYPDGSTDLVDVTVDVRKLSDEYEPTGTKIVKNQNATVTNDDLKAAVTISNNGNSKVKSVTPVGNISTTNAGTQTINATVTYLDGTTDKVTIPLEVKDVIAPTIQTPTEGQLWEITSLDKTLPPIRVETSDNSGGSGVKSIVPINLPSFLKFDKATNSIVFQDGVREVPKLSGINRTTKTVTLRVEDNAGNSSERTFQIRQISMAEKYDSQANTTIQEVSHGETPNPKTSVNTVGLPDGVQYTWKSTPDTNKPGDKTGVVTVTYPDDSMDEVTVTVKVRKLSDEYEPTGDKIVKNQNDLVSNDELKAAVTISNNGASKVKSVTPVNEISTTEFGDKTINATVTYLDDTTDMVTIPLEVKDVTPPTIQAPIENTNWEMTALDKTLPNMEVRAEDNANGSGVKTVSVEGLPDYLEYDSATNSIKFKAGKQEVEKLLENTPSKEFNLNIRVEDNAGNVSKRAAKITVSSISTKTNPQSKNQTVNYGQVPNPEDSVNKQGLPDGTTMTWKTPPVVNTPGTTTGEVEITYPDGSKDIITVNVTVKKVSEEFTATGTQIEVNQSEEVTSEMLKGAVNATNVQGENGNAKITKVESKAAINTATYGNQTIQAKVTYIDGSEQDVTIQLKVKDVTKPTIQAPTNGQNWDLIAVEGQDPNIAVTSEDNTGGSGVKSTTVTGLPNFLEYNESTKKIQFKAGVTQVPSLPEGTDIQPHNITIEVEDNAGNETTTNVTITVKSMTTKYEATANSQKQTVSYGATPDAGTSVDKTNLPEGTTYTWTTVPSTTEGPGDKAGVVTVTYPDGSKDVVNVMVTVKELSSEYDVVGSLIEVNQNTPVTNDELKAKVTATSKVGNIDETDKISTVVPKSPISTANYGDQTISTTVTFKDGTTKDVTIPLKVKDVTKPTIQAPTNGQNWDLIAVEGQDPNITVTSEDNTGGSGIKSTTVTGLPSFLAYDEATKTIKFKTGVTQVPSLPEGTDVQPHNITIEVEDNAGNKTSTQVTITVKSMTTKYEVTPNEQKQTVSYGEELDAGASINKSGLPVGTTYTWETKPSTTEGPGDKAGVVTVTYPDGSKDTVNVTVSVRGLADEYEPTVTKIVKNQNDTVSNEDLKSAVTISNNGNIKVKTVTTVGTISTTEVGGKEITATVTYLDDTTDTVTIPLEVKDVTAPTIQTPTNGQNWDLIAVEGQDPNIAVTSEDNVGGSGVKSTTVTGLPDFLEYNESTKKIQFKAGATSVPSLPEGTDEERHNITITVVDNAGNEATTNITITVKSMTTKYEATATPEKQTVSYGETPDAGASVNKTNLPEGTSYVWKTKPETTIPGEKDGVVEVKYKDGSKDTVNVKVTVKELSSEYDVVGSLIEVNQNTPVTNDDLKAKVIAESKVGNVDGTDKIAKVEPKVEISTANYGDQNITATVTFKDGTTKDVTIPLKVKDVTKPTIQGPTNGQNWDLIAVEGQDPNIAVISEDNTGGSGVKTTTVTGLPDFLEYNESTKKIQFKEGVTSVPSLPEGTDVEPHNVSITVVDNAGNEATTNVTITVKSMTTKYEATADLQKQTVSYGDTPDAEASIDKSGLPEGTKYKWTTTPDTNTPGEKDGVVEVTYKDGSKDTVKVKVTVKELSSEYDIVGSLIEVNQNDPVSNDDLKAKVTATSKVGNINGTDKISKVEPKAQVSTAAYGETNIEATVTFKDGTTKDVTIPLKVKDVTPPTIQAPIENTNWEMTALDKTLPNMEVRAEDNANGSGVKTVSVEGLPDYLEYDSATNSIKFKSGKREVEKLPENTPSKEFNLNIRVEDNAGNVSERAAKITVSSISTKANPQPEDQTVNYGQVPNPEDSVNKQGLPEGTTVTWKTPPVVNTPGSTTGEVEITYPDGSKDVITVNVTVRKVSEEFTATGTQIEVNQNEEVTSDMLKRAVNATNAQGENGNAKISKVESKSPVNTTTYGDQTIQAKVTYIDGSEQDVTIPLKVKDVTPPTIQTPTNGQNWDLIALEGTNPNISVTSEDNTGGSGVKTTTVTNLPDFLEYNESTKKIQFKAGVTSVPSLPEGTDVQPHNVKITVVDNAGNETSTQVTITVKSMTTKYEATANEQKQTVSYGEELDAGASINKSGLPTGTTYTWETKPSTTEGPGDKAGVVTVTYPDGSKDTINVTVSVRGLADEYEPTVTKIVKNQNDTVSSEDLKSAVTISNNGNIKVKTVTTVGTISTTEVGGKEITATVTYLDDTTDTVTIPLEVKDVTAPTIQTPTNGQNWDLIAVEGENPNIAVTSEDNAGGSGVKSTTVTGLPDFLEYNEVTKTIQFKAGITSVPSLPEGTDVEPHNVTITVVDNAGNETSTQVTITVKSMTTKYDAVPNSDKQTVSYGATPDAATSVDKTNLPEGTSYTWKTTPDTNTPGENDGVVEVTYKDGSKDTVNVKVNVNKLSDEYNVTATEIEVNQNTPVTNDDLKSKVTATSKEGNVSGTDKIAKVEPKAQVSTAAYGETNIEATVTFKDGTTKDVTIPLKVKDVTKPTIQAPTNGQNWDLIAVEGQDPNIAVTSEDNAGGSGVKSITVTGLPNFLEYNESTKKVQFKEGVTQVPSLPEGTDVQAHNITIEVEDNAGNKTSTQVTITVKSMTTKYNAVPNSDKQTVSYGVTPDAAISVDKTNLPEGTNYAWTTTPDTNTPGEKDGVVEVTYKDGSKDTVSVKVNVNKLSDEYNVTATEIEVNQNTPVTNDDLKAKVTATSKEGSISGTDKISTVVPKSPISTVNYGDQNISATVTFKDGTTKDVTIPLKVKDVTKPTIQAPTNGQNWDLIAVEGQDPNIAVTSEDNAGGSGVKSTTVTGLPDFLVYDEATKTIKLKTGVTQVPSLPEGTDVQSHNVTIEVEDNAGNKTPINVTITVKSMTTKYDAVPNSEKQTVSYGVTPDAATSVNTSGLPEGTSYTWKTTPVTTTPGEKDGVVEVTYKDGSKDTVNVKVNVKELSSEYEVTGSLIEVNQNTPVTNDDLKAKVTATSNEGNISGTDKILTVEPKAQVSTAAYGETNIEATVTFKDGTTKDVTIPLEVKDVTAPTIQTPTNGQNWDLIAVEGTNLNISVISEDNTGGSGVKTTTVTNLPNFLEYNESTKQIQFKAGVTSVPSLPEGTDVEPHNVTITVVDNAGNETITNVTITVKSMTTKYDAVPNPEKQTVSYGEELDAGASINKSDLPAGTNYIWEIKPSTTQGPGDKVGVVTVTYPDGSKDTVNVTVNVSALNDEYDVAGEQIEVNQNSQVTNDELKAKVTATSKVGNEDGTDKISKVEPKAEISTANYGNKNITATVTFKDGTTKEVTIPLKVKDVTPPTITAPTGNTNWEMTALDKTLPNMEVRAEDNVNGSGIKTVTVTGLPDYLEYDSATNTIKFKTGKQEVEKLTENTPSKEFNLNIRVEDNAGNISERTAKITISSISAKTNPQPNDQTVNYGQVPNPEDSVNKQELPDGTTVTWKTPPVVKTPGSTTGEVEITYPDGSKDVVTVNVTVRKVSEEFTATGTQIEVNQNEEVTSDMLKGAVNATNAQGENGNAKISKVESKSPINTTTYGDQIIQAKVTYIDGSEQDVTIPLKVKDVTNPTIQTPAENTNWEMTALDKTLPVMKIEAEDNANGSGIATIEVNNMPSFLTFDKSTGTIVFKEGVQEVPKIESDSITYGVTIIARDKAGNSISKLVNITVSSMRGKYNPQPKPQTVDNGTVPNAEGSVDKTGLPEGTRVTWKETPVVNTPGSHPTVALVTYPDGTVDEVEVPITVKKQSDTFTPTAKQPGQTAKHGSDPSAEGSINTNGLPSGTTYTWVEKPDTNTTPGSKPGKVLITYPDNSTEEVTVTVEVTPQKDDYNPQPKPQTVDNGTVPNAEDSVDKTDLPSGTKVTWKTNPDVSTPGSHPTVALVTYPDGTVDEVEVPITVKKQSDTFTPTAKQPGQTAKHGIDPSAEGSINTEGLPKGTTYTWVEKPDTNTTPGSKPGKVLITYPDNSTEEVTVTVEVTPQKDDYNPQPKPQTVDNGTVPNAEDSVDKTGLPSGTTIAWKETPVVNTPGSHPTVALVTYPDGTVDEVEVPITVKEQKDTYNPTAKQPGQTAKHGSDPSAQGSINTNGLPSGTTYTWVEKPDTNTTPGSKTGKVLITYPDNSTEEVTVTVEVTPQKDDYNPQPKAQTITNGDIPNVNDSIENVRELPEGTRIEWKDGIIPNTDTPGTVSAKITITYPDNTTDEVDVKIIVNIQTAKGEPEEHSTLPEFSGGVNGEPEEHPTLPEFNGGVNGDPEEQPTLPEFNGGVNGDPEEQPTLPEFNRGVNGDLEERPALLEFYGGVNGDPEEQSALPEFNGGVNGDPEERPTLPEFNGGVNGDPEEQPTLPEFNGGVNGDPEEQPALPEFSGGVNGEPEEHPALPEFSGGVNGEPEVQPDSPEFSGGVNGDSEIQPDLPKYVGRVNNESEIRSNFRENTSNIATKRLANTGQSQNNSELAGVGLAIVGLFAAIKRRNNEEE